MRRLILLGMTMVTLASSQDIYGEWVDRKTGETLKLSEDGNFTWGPNVGSFYIEEQSILFEDALTGSTASYALAFAGDVMQLTDYWMGERILFVRKGSPAENLPLDVILEDVQSVSPELASKDGFILREDDTRLAFEVIEFLIGKSLSEEESNTLLDEWIGEFETAPAEFKAQLGRYLEVRNELYRTTDPLDVARLRQRVLSETEKETKDVPLSEQQAFSRAVHTHLKVLASDSETGLLLTDLDLSAYLDYLMFLASLSVGRPQGLSETLGDSLERSTAFEFPSWPSSKKEFVSSSHVLYIYFTYAWDRADTQRRSEIAKGMLGERAASVDFGMLAPGLDGAARMDEAARTALAAVLKLDQRALMKVWSEGVSWPYYYEISTP